MENGNSKSENEKSINSDKNQFSDFQFPVSGSPAGERPHFKYILIGAAALAVLVVIAVVAMRSRTSGPSAPVELTPEQKEYLAHIQISGAKMSAATNFLGQRVIYLDAQVANQGPRAVKQVEVKMDFTDLLGQVIFREHAGIFPPAMLPLKPGETREFQLFFDNVPSDWNQAPPRITVTAVQFD